MNSSTMETRDFDPKQVTQQEFLDACARPMVNDPKFVGTVARIGMLRIDACRYAGGGGPRFAVFTQKLGLTVIDGVSMVQACQLAYNIAEEQNYQGWSRTL